MTMRMIGVVGSIAPEPKLVIDGEPSGRRSLSSKSCFNSRLLIDGSKPPDMA
jgi:hypothetical protein